MNPEQGDQAEQVHNMNEQVSFMATPWGKYLLRAKFNEEIKSVPEGRFSEKTIAGIEASYDQHFAEDGSVVIQLWEMANIFGPYFSHVEQTVMIDNTFSFKQPK